MTPTTLYLASTGGFAVALGLCVAAALRGSFLSRVVALEMAGVVATLLLTVLTVALHRPSSLIVPLALACLTAPGSLIFVHVAVRWLEESR